MPSGAGSFKGADGRARAGSEADPSAGGAAPRGAQWVGVLPEARAAGSNWRARELREPEEAAPSVTAAAGAT